MQHMERTAQKRHKKTHNSRYFKYVCVWKCGKATTYNYLRAAKMTPNMYFSYFLPFKCFSPHFQLIRPQYSCACASPQSGMHLEKAFSNSDWRQAGRQRERESEGGRELRIEWKQEEVYEKRGVAVGVMGNGEKRKEREGVKEEKWLTWCHAASLHQTPGRKRRSKMIRFIYQADLSGVAAAACCGPPLIWCLTSSRSVCLSK